MCAATPRPISTPKIRMARCDGGRAKRPYTHRGSARQHTYPGSAQPKQLVGCQTAVLTLAAPHYGCTWDGKRMKATMRDHSVAVVIPTYNRSSLLKRAIETARSQTYPVSEIIVVDDGSQDDTPQVVTAIAASDSRVQLIRQTNAGANAARNAGIAKARSSWIAFLDSDDQWLPRKVERQIEAAIETDRDAVFTSAIGVDGDRKLYDFATPVEVSLEEICTRNSLGTTSVLMAKKSLLQAVGSFDSSLPSCQDWDLYIKLRQRTDFAIVPEQLVLYEDGPHERISNNKDRVVAGHKAVFSRAVSALGGPGRARTQRAHHHLMLAKIRGEDKRRFALHVTAAALLAPDGKSLRASAGAIRGIFKSKR